jgi:AcrR family transcriptional regulator
MTTAMETPRDKIAAAAQELYLREGIDGVSMRKVADIVGVSAPAIYRHFRNKGELLNEIVVEGLKILEGYLRPALEAATPYERLVAMIDNYLRFALEQPKYFDFAFLVPAADIGAIPEEIVKRDWSTFGFAIEQVEHCVEQGYFAKTEDPVQIAIVVWAAAHGLVTLYRTGRFGPDPAAFREIYRLSIERVLDGLRAPDAPRPDSPGP